MIKNYFKVALRNISRHKGNSLINITGLAVGIAVCILILLWIQDEVSINRFHAKIDHLYLVPTQHDHGTHKGFGIGAPPAVAPALKEEYPEVVNATRYQPPWYEFLMKYEDKLFTENVAMADAAFFQMFSFPFLEGDAQNPYGPPHSIVMTKKMAEKYFGGDKALGKTVTLDNKWGFTVTGVIENVPANSTLQFDFVVPQKFQNERYDKPNSTETWYNCSFYNFIELADNTDEVSFEKKIAGRIGKSRPQDSHVTLFLEPYKDVYLHGIAGRASNIGQVRIFGLIAIMILLIACINFVNLATARSAKRAKEVGIRKVSGAQRRDLVWQFFGEAFMLVFISLFIAILLVELLLPVFNTLSDKTLGLDISAGNPILLLIAAITLFTGIVSGSYPALLLSSYRPAAVIRGTLDQGSGKGLFRRALVILQFSVSIALIVSTIVVYKQLQFMKQKDLGLDKTQLVYVPLKGPLEKNHALLKTELLKIPGVIHAARSSNLPTGIYQNGDLWQWEGRDESVNPLMTYLSVDSDFLQTYRLQLLEGGFFDERLPTKTDQVIINENFARLLGEGGVVGKQIWQKNSDTGKIFRFTIRGVVRDFNYKPLTREMGPIILFYENSWWTSYRFASLKISPNDISGTISAIGAVVKEQNPAFPFEYTFLDEDYGRMYQRYERMGTIFNHFSLLAIFISCLGLLGLASYMAQQKTKEIGIRKALGASVTGVVTLLSKDFTKWVLISNLIAWPVSYYLMNQFLEDFAYKTSLTAWIFLLAGAMALAIALLSVSYQSLKAARSNPVEALRYE